MNGTEKQISYAKSLVAKFIEKANYSLQFKNTNHPDDVKQREERKLVISVLESFDGNASDCIDVLAYFSFENCMNHDTCSKMIGYKKFWKFISENTPVVAVEEIVCEYSVVESEKIESAFVVVDSDFCPIAWGKFYDKADAEYVCKKMNEGEINGDHISDLCLEMKSCVGEQ